MAMGSFFLKFFFPNFLLFVLISDGEIFWKIQHDNNWLAQLSCGIMVQNQGSLEL